MAKEVEAGLSTNNINWSGEALQEFKGCKIGVFDKKKAKEIG